MPPLGKAAEAGESLNPETEVVVEPHCATHPAAWQQSTGAPKKFISFSVHLGTHLAWVYLAIIVFIHHVAITKTHLLGFSL